jgi:xanthine dehydrogenase FAD-binding subunit
VFDIASYEEANSVQHAIDLLAANPQAQLIAGGTDVVIRLREGKVSDANLISIHDLDELKGVSIKTDGTIVIKPVTTFASLAEHPIIQQHLPFLGEAVSTVGGPQTRHVGTIGGNVCNGATSADSASTLFALNARLCITGPSGIRISTIQDFYKGPGKVALTHGEILTAILISPKDYLGFSGHYIKYTLRNAMDIAMLGCSVTVKLGIDNSVADFRLAFGVAAPTPMRCWRTEAAVKGHHFSEDLVERVGELAVSEVNPRTSWRASKEYRLQLVGELSKRAFRKAMNKTGGKGA